MSTTIRRELKTDILVGGKSHLIKERERMRRLKKLLDYGNLSKKDTMIAKKLYNDLKKAFGDYYVQHKRTKYYVIRSIS